MATTKNAPRKKSSSRGSSNSSRGATKTRARSQTRAKSRNGGAKRTQSRSNSSPRRATSRLETAKQAATKAKGPAVALGAAAAGLAGGLALKGRKKRKTVLGVPIGSKGGAVKTLELLRDGAKHLSSATGQISGTAEDVREIREQLDRANRKSPLEVVLDGLTHRRGAHKRES
jgi:hypothetical protein